MHGGLAGASVFGLPDGGKQFVNDTRAFTKSAADTVRRKYYSFKHTGNRVKSEVTPQCTPHNVELDEGKFKYLFGEVTSGRHNTLRSNSMRTVFGDIGIFNTQSGIRALREHLEESLKLSNVIKTSKNKHGVFETRESLFWGPLGPVKLVATWEVLKDGTRRFVTVIPMK